MSDFTNSQNNVQMVPSLEEQGKKGVELTNVFTNPTSSTFPFGAFDDPFQPFGVEGFKRKSQKLNHQILRNLADSIEPVSAIVLLRQTQVAAFSRLSNDRDMPGFCIQMIDPEMTPDEQDKKEIAKIGEFFSHTGFSNDVDRPRDDFEHYQRMIVRDSMVLDAVTTQLISNKKGELVEFRPMDAATILFAQDNYQTRGRFNTKNAIKYVQEYNGQVFGEFTYLEMAYGIRNKTTDLRSFGYGKSELEMLIAVVTSYLYAREYNKAYFTKNNVPAGILSLQGKYTTDELEMFKRMWNAQVRGVNNAWRVPMIASEDGKGVTFQNLKANNREAEFMKWMDFLIKMCCAVYMTGVEELNFASGNSSSGNPFIAKEGSSAIQTSKDRGFVPLLRFLENYYNTNITHRLNPRLKFAYTGVEPEDRQQKAQLKTLRKFYMSVNQLRAEDDMQPLVLMVGKENVYDHPDDPVIRQMLLQMAQMDQQAQQPQAAQEEQPEEDTSPYEEDLENPETLEMPKLGEGK